MALPLIYLGGDARRNQRVTRVWTLDRDELSVDLREGEGDTWLSGINKAIRARVVHADFIIEW